MNTQKQLSDTPTIASPDASSSTKKTSTHGAAVNGDHSSENRNTPKTRDSVSRNWHNLDNRLSMIAESAYFKAEKREFVVGHEESDWLEAEQELARIMGEA